MRFAAFAFASLLAFGVTASSQDSPPPVTDWSMEVVVVDAEAQGPAFWRIKKGDSEIYIMGTVGLMPAKLAWNSAHLAKVVEGSNEVLLSPRAHSGVLDLLGMSWFIFTHRDALSMPDDQKLEPSLSPETRARFVRARQQVKKDADRYEDDSPLVAGFRLLGDYLEANQLAQEVADNAVEKIARGKHVKVRRIAEYSANPLVREMLELPRASGQVCFETALNDYETLEKHAVPAADAWAVGDVAGLKAHYSASMFLPCIGQAKKFGEIDHRAVGDTMKAIHQALSRPGKTVMVANLGWLFRAGGVADALKGEGIAIEGPAEKSKSES